MRERETDTEREHIHTDMQCIHMSTHTLVKLCVCVFKLLVTLGSGLRCSHSTYSNIPVVSEGVSMSMHCILYSFYTYSDNEINIMVQDGI